ncbi:hypothetical protein IQ268_11340 [Oculatella sp. LEGE 06141]|uniref:hypothetical protein n=1 Tax=Oculatella sp. LEGE 06141 TaxID=1828648 RepID=UPI001880D49F|nr:hypothetical protein [Oculatella sp. LEGE 06141]MBE9179154.1 hypothetical protein [Oculatella sp. LEGE 06141]
MTLDHFMQLLDGHKDDPPPLPRALQALWYDKKGNWEKAHDIVQNANDGDSSWVHAYLHRKEGDLSNARYWYRRIGQPECQIALEKEWQQIARSLLMRSGSGARP